MGTNFYWARIWTFSGYLVDVLHIGKSSAGWCFGLHVYPEKNINTLDDWRARLHNTGSVIFTEYNRLVSIESMIKTITDRHWNRGGDVPAVMPEDWYVRNHAIPGPNGLVRHAPRREGKRFVVGPGPGTWDYLTGEFC